MEDDDEHNDAGEFPIQKLLYMYGTGITGCTLYFNLKAIPFIALLVWLGIALNQFREQERGGLLTMDALGETPLYHLTQSSDQLFYKEHNQHVDNTSLAELIQLRQMSVLIKEDIIDHDLVIDVYCESYFAENRCQFLIKCDPTTLMQTDEDDGCLLIHYAESSIQTFQFVFDYIIRYYPTKKGISLLFKKDNNNDTPFQDACGDLGREEVMKVVEETLCRYLDTTLDIVEALVLAATDETVHLDCVHFLLTREPDMLVKLLSRSTDNNDNDDNHNTDDDGDDSIIKDEYDSNEIRIVRDGRRRDLIDDGRNNIKEHHGPNQSSRSEESQQK